MKYTLVFKSVNGSIYVLKVINPSELLKNLAEAIIDAKGNIIKTRKKHLADALTSDEAALILKFAND